MKKHRRRSFTLVAPLLIPLFGLVLGVLPGCGRDEVRAYRAPKDPAGMAVASQTSLPAARPSAGVVWTVPADWVEAPNQQSMRLATFVAGLEGIEVSLAAFPGDVGGDLANINRWRGQLGLAPITEAELPTALRTSVVSGTEVSFVELDTPEGVRMLGAIVEPGDGQTWFVKATGEADSISAIAGSFEQFAQSIRLDADAHAGHDHAPPAPAPSPSGPDDPLDQRLASWSPPPHWTPEPDASPILSASYLALNDAGGARITVTRLTGDGGGALANINRWRGQLGLAPAGALDEGAGVVSESPLVVDLIATESDQRMVAAIVPAGAVTYYFKMTGDSAGAGAERAGFDLLVAQVGLGADDR